MDNPLYPIIEGMMTYLTKNGLHFCTLKDSLPRYFTAIMEETKQADEYCVAGDKEQTEIHAKRAMGYFKKAMTILKGGNK